jgi:CRISPR-associated exonuclease Cas4
MIFALTRAWALALRSRSQQATAETLPRGRSGSVFLLIEEPELFLHPHAQRRLNESLREISKSDHHQVFLCTHSPHFVRIDDYRKMAIVDKPSAEQGSRVRQCRKDLFAGEDSESCKCRFNMAHWINPERAELFFARRTVFVEGATERAVIPFVADLLGCFDPDVSVVDCGSKFNLPLYMEIAGAFGLEHIVVHDEDPVPPTVEGDKLKSANRTFAMNAKIGDLATAAKTKVEMLAPDFEGCTGVSKSQGEKKGKPLAAIDFLKSLDPKAIPDRIQKLVRTVYQCGDTNADDSRSRGGSP